MTFAFLIARLIEQKRSLTIFTPANNTFSHPQTNIIDLAGQNLLILILIIRHLFIIHKHIASEQKLGSLIYTVSTRCSL